MTPRPSATMARFKSRAPVRPAASSPSSSTSKLATRRGPLGRCGPRAYIVRHDSAVGVVSPARTCAFACRATRRTRSALARSSFCPCCGRRGLGGYPRNGVLSFFHGPGYVGHQLFQIVLGGLKLRRLCVHFHPPIHRPPQGEGSPAVFRAKVNSL